MKKRTGIFLGAILLLFLVRTVSANEGVVNLVGDSAFEGQCFAVSIFEERMYRVLVSCRNLPVAMSAEANYYVLWSENDKGKVYRLGEIERGKLSTANDQPFEKLFVTVESRSYPGKASETRVLSGAVEPLPFVKSESVSKSTEVVITPTLKVTPTPEPLIPQKVKKESSTFRKVLGVIGRVIGIGIFVLVVAGVVLTVVTRRKEG